MAPRRFAAGVDPTGVTHRGRVERVDDLLAEREHLCVRAGGVLLALMRKPLLAEGGGDAAEDRDRFAGAVRELASSSSSGPRAGRRSAGSSWRWWRSAICFASVGADRQQQPGEQVRVADGHPVRVAVDGRYRAAAVVVELEHALLEDQVAALVGADPRRPAGGAEGQLQRARPARQLPGAGERGEMKQRPEPAGGKPSGPSAAFR
jgi:hypothetical protein